MQWRKNKMMGWVTEANKANGEKPTATCLWEDDLHFVKMKPWKQCKPGRGKHFIPSKGNEVSRRLLHRLGRNVQKVGHFHEVFIPLLVLKLPEKTVLYLEGAIFCLPMDGHTSRPLFQSFWGQLSRVRSKLMSLWLCFCGFFQSQKAKKPTQKATGLKGLEILEIQGIATWQEKADISHSNRYPDSVNSAVYHQSRQQQSWDMNTGTRHA